MRRIGGGGMGEVFEATHERLAIRYAVKFLRSEVRDDPEALPRFMREAQVTSRLRHAGIVTVLDFNTLPNGTAYLVMEYLEGEALGKILARTGPMPLARVADLTEQMSAALSAAHAQGIVHRDIHPQNVLVLPPADGHGERVKVLDFGISKLTSASLKITGQGAVMGAPRYMSPEQAEGKTNDLDPASDQFSLAAIVYEMLTGRPAFLGKTLASIAYQVVHATPTPARMHRPDLPPEVENVVSRALAKNKQDRFASVAEFALHLSWTASLPQSPSSPLPFAAPDGEPTRVIDAAEEPTPVSMLPSGMAAVLRETTGTPAVRDVRTTPRGDAIGEAEGAPTAVASAPGRRRLVLTAAALAGLLAMIGVAVLARSPASHGTTGAAAAPAAVAAPVRAAPATSVRAAAATFLPAAAAAPARVPTPPSTERPAAGGPPPPAEAAAGTPPARARPSGERPRPALKRAAASERADEGVVAAPEISGTKQECLLTVGSYPWSELWIDGADTGQHTPVVRYPVACGAHKLELKRSDLRMDEVENVILQEGSEFKRHFDLAGAGVDN